MEFDRSRVYTPFNFDEVKIGSKGYFADTKDSLIDRVLSEDKSYYHKMIEYNKCKSEFPFISDIINSAYTYFYLVEEPKEKRPCMKTELVEMLKKQGLPMLKISINNCDVFCTVESISDDNVYIGGNYSYEALCRVFTLLDGSELWIEED